jgi:hypothetical protein
MVKRHQPFGRCVRRVPTATSKRLLKRCGDARDVGDIAGQTCGETICHHACVAMIIDHDQFAERDGLQHVGGQVHTSILQHRVNVDGSVAPQHFFLRQHAVEQHQAPAADGRAIQAVDQ